MTNAVLEYEAIFSHRGDSYAAAMEACPDARAAEFANLLRHVDLDAVHSVADVPSGSGYLAAYLPVGAAVDAYDPAPSFRDRGEGIYPVALGRPALVRRDYDLIISLASLHHIGDKTTFFRSLADHVRPGGKIVIADVAASSRVAAFLDGFIGRHNGTGHDGMYLAADSPFDFGLGHERLDDVRIETLPCPWRFRDHATMIHFCALLFGAATASPPEVEEAITDIIGVETRNGFVEMKWELTYITASLT